MKESDGEDDGEDDGDDKLPHHPNHLPSISTFYPLIWTLSCMHLSEEYVPSDLLESTEIDSMLPTYSVSGRVGSSYEGSHGVVCMLELDCMKADATSEASLPTSCRNTLLMSINLSCHLIFVLVVILFISLVIILSLD